MLDKYLSLDFEYKGTNQSRLDLVSIAFTDGVNSKSIWLHKDEDKKQKVKKALLQYRDQGHKILSWNLDAEGRGLIALGINPIKWPSIDLQAEYKMLTNHNDSLGYGKQVINGQLKRTYRRGYGDSGDKRAHDRTPTNLLAGTYKLLGKFSTQDYINKNNMRDKILNSETYSPEDIKEILAYGLSDIVDLKAIYDAQLKQYKKLYTKKEMAKLFEQQLYRGNTVARAAVIACIGYPVSREKVENFTKNIPLIVKDVQEDINVQFPDMNVFKWNKKEERFTQNTKAAKTWIESSPYAAKWAKTDGGDYSLSLEAWEEHFSYRHEFPRDNFPAQYLRYLKTMQSLNGFKPPAANAQNKETFFSYYGDDDRAHPYLNAYGSQSARYQPKATGFLHLKAAWMRSMVEPRPGRAIAAIDFGSEEFLISALVSGDQNMLDSYASGDVYLYFAKLAGAVPMDGKKEDYKLERNRFKSTVLAMSYGMGAAALAAKLTMETGVPHTREQAQELIDKFYAAYPDYEAWVWEIKCAYTESHKLMLPDGWTMFGDNDNIRSVCNFPIQGVGACILKKAIEFCQDAGLTVIIPLHDALYVEYTAFDYKTLDIMADCMKRAFAFYFTESYDLALKLIRLDCDTWSPDYEEKYGETTLGLKYKQQKLYVDERSEAEFKKFSKYFV